jgi:pimeloyl-ACP methyl ester carboxylesterase
MVATAVLVHGAWHGAWCWDAVLPLLAEAGVTAVTVDLPSMQRTDATLADAVAAVHSVLDAVGEPVVLVGHSYGGVVVTEAGVHPNVERLVYVCAFALDDGESATHNELEGGKETRLAGAIVPGEGTYFIDATRAVECFYHDCTPDDAAAATKQLRPMAQDALHGVPQAIAWRDKPASYIVCTDDRAVPPPLQRNVARRCGESIDIHTSHSPFLSAPVLFVDTLVPFLEWPAAGRLNP